MCGAALLMLLCSSFAGAASTPAPATRGNEATASNGLAGAHFAGAATAEPEAPPPPAPAAPVAPASPAPNPSAAPEGKSGDSAPASEETVPLLVTVPPPDKVTDGVYGRFEGDLELSLAAGGAFGPGGPNVAALARASFFQTAGLYVAYTDAAGRENAALRRSLALGVNLRPFFLPRWALDLEHGPAIVDLTIDSIGFDLGVLWASDTSGGFTDRPGMEAALGFEVPVLGKASGPFIGARGAIRWRGTELAGEVDDRLKPVLFLTLAWHSVIDANIVDAGDRRLR